jgi:Trk K+ transport system NAD-binding subunit
MAVEKQKVLIFGLGIFGKTLLNILAADWHVIAIDIDKNLVQRLKNEIPGVELHHGAASSQLTWKKPNLSNLKYIISTIKEPDNNLEICRLARDVFNLEIPILILMDRELETNVFAPYHATLINPLQPGIHLLLKELGKNVTHAVNVGLGKGELIEVSIKARSHLVDRELRYLKPKAWHISALYREGRLLLPCGTCTLKVGDRVVLVGEPKVLENVTTILLKGLPQFPLQYGSDIVFPLHVDFTLHLDEAIYWLNNSKARQLDFIPFKKKISQEFVDKIKTNVKSFKIRKPVELFKEIFLISVDTGILVIPVCKEWVNRSRVKLMFKKSRKPFLISRLTYPYEGIIISFNGPDPVQALQTGIEIARLLNSPYRVVYVTPPKEMRGREEDQHLRFRRNIISDFEGIYKTAIDYQVREGNPVRQTLDYLKPFNNHLLVMVSDTTAPISFFQPHIPYWLAKKTRLSTLVIPESQTHE